jgi:hypothetical protein
MPQCDTPDEVAVVLHADSKDVTLRLLWTLKLALEAAGQPVAKLAPLRRKVRYGEPLTLNDLFEALNGTGVGFSINASLSGTSGRFVVHGHVNGTTITHAVVEQTMAALILRAIETSGNLRSLAQTAMLELLIEE